MRTFFGFMKAAGLVIGICTLLGAVTDDGGNIIAGALVGAVLSAVPIFLGGMTYRFYALMRRGRPVARWIPALLSVFLVLILALLFMMHATSGIDSGGTPPAIAGFLLFVLVFGAIAAVFGSGVGQLSRGNEQCEHSSDS